MSTVYVFPGQGSQAVGMGKALYDAFPVAREVYQEVNDTLSQNLSQLMFEGPESDLTLTENTQPAIMACSVAAFRVLEKEGGLKLNAENHWVAGHSLGEYSALTAAKSLKLHDAARLLRIRGQAMQRAVKPGEGAMAAIIGLTIDPVREIAREVSATGEVCDVANDNNDQQIVISGSRAGIDRGMALAKEKGAKRVVELQVSAPFHCALMQSAADTMQLALEGTEFRHPEAPLVANVNAQRVESPDTIRSLLVKQVCGTVRWRESMLYLKEHGVTRLVEVGHGKVLTGLMKRIAPEVECINLAEPADFEALAKAA